jgi:hypothetical protein
MLWQANWDNPTEREKGIMPEIKVVIRWKKIDPWRKVLDKNEGNDYGVYQVTGYHPVFGDNSLLYIGMTRDQNFSTRFGQHEDWLEREWGVKVYVGRVDKIDDEDEIDYNGNRWRAVVFNSEALLIYYHSPPYNCKHISKPPEPYNNLRIINIGDYGELTSEISHYGLRIDGIPPPRPVDEDQNE